MIYNYNILPEDFVSSSVLIPDITRPYKVEDSENSLHDVFYAFTGSALTEIEFTVDSNADISGHSVVIEVVSLGSMGENYFAFHVHCPWYRYSSGEPDRLSLTFNGTIYTDNPNVYQPFRFMIRIDGCQGEAI